MAEGSASLRRGWLRWRLRRAERKWLAADEELCTVFIAVSQARMNKLYWLRDTILPERISYLRSQLLAAQPQRPLAAADPDPVNPEPPVAEES